MQGVKQRHCSGLVLQAGSPSPVLPYQARSKRKGENCERKEGKRSSAESIVLLMGSGSAGFAGVFLVSGSTC